MKAHKLPSGAYRVRVFYYDADGKRHAKSFTDPDKDTAKRMAQDYEYTHASTPLTSGSFGKLMDAYITARTALLSPSTIRGYVAIQKRLTSDYRRFCEAPAYTLSKGDVQGVINSITEAGSKPKTIRNIHGLIMGVLKENGIHVARTTLPPKQPREITVPDEPTVREVLKAVKGTELEVPVMLAAFAGLRRGEVCALKIEDIDFRKKIVHVSKDVVLGPDKEWHTKHPKTKASDRYIDFKGLEKVLKVIKKQGYVTHMDPGQLDYKFRNKVREVLPKKKWFRFHDLRHFCASYLHSLSVPDSYIMQRCGWENDACLKNIYRHTLADQEKKFAAIANENFVTFL